MDDPRRVQRGQGCHQRHKQRPRFLPAKVASGLLKPGFQGDSLAKLAYRVGGVVLFKDIIKQDQRGEVPHSGQSPGMIAEFGIIILIGVLTTGNHPHLLIFTALTQSAGKKFPNGDGRLLHLIKADIYHRIAAGLQHPPHRVPVGQNCAHRQIGRRIFPARGIAADAAGIASFRQGIHTAHAKTIR